LARHVFEVSVEVLLRRFGDRLDPSETCFALSRDNTLEFAMYPAWLKGILWTPPGETAIVEWLRSSDLKFEPQPDGSYCGIKANEAIVVRRIPTGRNLNLFEIRRCSVEASSRFLLPPTPDAAEGGGSPVESMEE
jgi:hypothetical protein